MKFVWPVKDYLIAVQYMASVIGHNFWQNLYPHTEIPRSYDVHLKSKNHSGIHSSGLCIFFLWKALNPAVHSDKPRKNFLSEQKLWFLNIVSNYHSNKIVVNSQMICLNV